MKNNHICFICPYIQGYLNPGEDRAVGGAERQQYLIACEFRNKGHNVSFITFRENSQIKQESVDGFNVIYSLPKTNDSKYIFHSLSSIYKSMRDINADMYYVRGNPPLCILSSLAAKLLRKNYVYCVANDSNIQKRGLKNHHDLFKYSIVRSAFFHSIKSAEVVISQTEKQKSILNDEHGITSVKIPNMYEKPDDCRIEEADERKYILWVGSLTKQKMPQRYVELAKCNPNIQFKMVGPSTNSEFGKDIATHSKKMANFEYIGFVPPDQIDKYYKNAIALVNTSDYEGFPNTFLEAWRYGIPVLSLYFDLDKALQINDIGVHAGSMQNLSQTIQKFASEPDVAYEIGMNGRKYFTQNFRKDKVFKKYENELLE